MRSLVNMLKRLREISNSLVIMGRVGGKDDEDINNNLPMLQ